MSRLLLDIYLINSLSIPEQNAYYLEYTTSEKFINDKIKYEDDRFLLVLDGIVLNKSQLLLISKVADWTKLLISLYLKNGTHFFKYLKGSYYGFLFDKKEIKWIIFSDHINSKPMYYAKWSGHICFSNDYTTLLSYLKTKGIKLNVNQYAAYLLLSYGFVFEDLTISNEIKRLKIGNCAVLVNSHLHLEKYYSLNNIPIAISEEDAIEEIERRFNEVIKQAFDKDIEYGYKHVATLSGGLDSRMTVCVAHSLGYKTQLNLTFSQSDYLDETIAKKIANDLRHEWLFKALDNGIFLTDIDKITQITGGNVLFYGLAHQLSLYKYINFENLGIVHTGQLGDVVLSSFFTSLDSEKQYRFGDGAYSQRILSEIEEYNFKGLYPNEEITKMYVRGFYGANQGLKSIQSITETFSPFYDIDFMDFAWSIPLKLRYRHYLYKKWILKKHPTAAKYIWEKERVPINYPLWLNINGKRIPINQLANKIFSILGYQKYGISTKSNMNPLEYWYQTNNELRIFLNNYFKYNINLLDSIPKLKKDSERLYNYGNGLEKIQVLSLLAGVKLLSE